MAFASEVCCLINTTYQELNIFIYSYEIEYVTKTKSKLSCQPRVTVTSCFVYIVIRDSESIDYLCINPIHRIGLIHK